MRVGIVEGLHRHPDSVDRAAWCSAVCIRCRAAWRARPRRGAPADGAGPRRGRAPLAPEPGAPINRMSATSPPSCRRTASATAARSPHELQHVRRELIHHDLVARAICAAVPVGTLFMAVSPRHAGPMPARKAGTLLASPRAGTRRRRRRCRAASRRTRSGIPERVPSTRGRRPAVQTGSISVGEVSSGAVRD